MKMNDLLRDIAVVLSTVVLSMGGYWMMIGRELTTRADVAVMIADNQRVVEIEITHLRENRKELTDALKQNTEAINDLRIAIAEITHNEHKQAASK